MRGPYWVLFGRTPELSYAECRSLGTALFPKPIRRPIKEALYTQELDPKKVMARLGGAIRVTHELVRCASLPGLEEALSAYITAHELKEIGVSGLGATPSLSLAQAVKKRVSHPVSYRAHRSGMLNARTARILEGKGAEFIVLEHDGQYILTRTCAVQTIDEWSARDFGRPEPDPKSGMLPPKVARMMVNIALGEQDPSEVTLLDPFCGSGTIIAEALMIGCNVVGMDINKNALEKTRANLAWLKQRFNPQGTYRLLHQDATHLELCKLSAICKIVTEGYLGPSRRADMTPGKVSRVVTGISRLTIGFLRATRSLPELTHICMATPTILDNSGRAHTFSLLDSCEKQRYSVATGPLEYSRPKAFVRRSIWLLSKGT